MLMHKLSGEEETKGLESKWGFWVEIKLKVGEESE